MGSFDSTCGLTNVGIGCGDRIAAIFIAEGKYSHEFWAPISAPLFGSYADYGDIDLDDDEASLAFVEHMKSRVVAVSAGENPYHDNAVTSQLDWDMLTTAELQNKLYIRAEVSDDDKIGVTEYEALVKILKDGGIAYRHVYETYHLNMFIVELDYGKDLSDDPTIEEARQLLKLHNYDVVVISDDHWEKDPIKKHVKLMVFPSLDSEGMINFDYNHNRGKFAADLRVKMLFVRADVIDYLAKPEEVAKYSEIIRQRRDDHRPYGSLTSNLQVYLFQQDLMRGDDWVSFRVESNRADQNDIIPQILKIPKGSPASAYEPWARLYLISQAARGWMRRGWMPTARLVGSQCASADRPKQKKLHALLAKILRK